MDKLRILYNKHKKKFLIIEFIICVLLIAVIYMQKGTVDEIAPAQMNLSVGEIVENGMAYIDGSYEYGGAFLDADTKQLPKGTYKIHVLYDTDYDDNGFVVTANNANLGVINSDIGSDTTPIAFKSYHNERSVHAWLKQESSIHVQMRFCGAGHIGIERIVVERIPNYTPFFVLAFLLIAFHVWCYEKEHYALEIREKHRLVRAALLFITIVASAPLMVDYLVQGTDMAFHLYRIQGVADGIRSGQFPVRIQPNWWDEFGYGVSLFYGDLFLYFPAILTLLGYSLQIAYKVYIVALHLLTAWISYKCFMKIVRDEYIALFGACLYTLNIYRLMDIYMRGAVGEFTALTFLPLLIAGIYCIKEDGWIYLALGMTGCIQSHILTCEMTVVFLIIFCIVCIKFVIQKTVFVNLCKSVLCTILWNIWFIIPLLNVYSGNYNVKTGGQYVGTIQDRGAFPAEVFKLFINGLVGDQGVSGGISGEMGHSVGLALGVGLAISVMVLYTYRERIGAYIRETESMEKKPVVVVGGLCTGLALIALWLSTNLFPYDPISGWSEMWRNLVGHIQFPWRFLGFVSLFCTFAVVCSVRVWKNINVEQDVAIKLSIVLMIGLTLVGMSAFYHEMLSRETVITRSHEFLAVHKLMDQTEYLIEGTDMGDLNHELIIGDSKVEAELVSRSYTTLEIECANNNAYESYIDVPLFYYPCYRAVDRDTGELLNVDYGTNNRVRIVLPAEYTGTCVLKVRERMIWRLTEVISLCSFLGFIFYYMTIYKKKQKNVE